MTDVILGIVITPVIASLYLIAYIPYRIVREDWK